MPKVNAADFSTPFVDIDEWRDAPRPHRYIHGGFWGTHTLFSFYFPPEDLYNGRFFHFLEGSSGGHETMLTAGFLTPANELFDFIFAELGGYLLESNQGHFHNEGQGAETALEWYQASAASARYAKVLAEQIYGVAPAHGYVWGASGGGVRSIACLEQAPELYDGSSPNIGGLAGIQQQWSAVGYWWLHCRHRRDDIIDATAPGGSGDPFLVLTHDERDGLAAVYRHGYPRGAEAFLWSAMVWMLSIVQEMPYYEEFWTKPGFLGHDNPASLQSVLVDCSARVGRVLRLSQAPPTLLPAMLALAGGAPDQHAGVELEQPFADPTQLFGATVTITSGAAAGRTLVIQSVEGDSAWATGELESRLFDDVKVGDDLHIDNRRFIAWCYLHRYNIRHEDYLVEDPETGRMVLPPEFSGLRAGLIDGRPIHPQVPAPAEAGETYHSGKFAGKMIHLNATTDSLMWPVTAAHYHRKVRKHHAEATDAHYRLWWMDTTAHGPAELVGPLLTPDKDGGAWKARFCNLDGMTFQALRDLVAWVEKDIAPPATSAYRFNEDGGIVQPQSATARGGIQPVAHLSVQGGAIVEVNAGEIVEFHGSVETPPGSGTLVWAQWDFDGNGTVSQVVDFDGSTTQEVVTASHTYKLPGTYFPVFRVGAHRDGRAGRGPAMEHLARVRVVVI